MTTIRAGTGYDIHRLGPGRRLVLGGVEVPHAMGLQGHSDGDALTHAVIDALLGACGLPDIGQQFPPGDPRFEDAISVELLAQATALARDAGWQPLNADATIICERPKLAPFVGEIRRSLGERLGLPAERVNVKAKTNEGLDAVGRGEAIAVHAIILVGVRE